MRAISAFDLGIEALSNQSFNEGFLLEQSQLLWDMGSSIVCGRQCMASIRTVASGHGRVKKSLE